MPSTDDRAEQHDNRNGLARVALAGVIWGTIPLVIRAADGASLIKVFYRVAFAAVAVIIVMAIRGRLSEITGLRGAKLRQVAGQAVILTLNWAFFLTALDLVDVATVELLAYTGPVFVTVLAPFVTGEPFDRRVLVPLGLALGGVGVILAPHAAGVTDPRGTLGAGLAFLSALTYATLLLRSKNILRGISGGALMAIEYTLASALLLPVVAVLYARGQGPTSPQAYAALLTLGVVHTAFAGFVFLGGLRRVRTDHAAILTYAEPVSAVLFAALFLNEPLTASTLVGGTMVVAGGLIVARLRPRQKPQPMPLEAVAVEGEPTAGDPFDVRRTP